MGLFSKKQQSIIDPEQALPGRDQPINISGIHFVNQTVMMPPFPMNMETAYFALGCFWGAERLFWELDGVHTTAVGYQGGYTPNPTYDETCTGQTAHAETVLVVFDPEIISYEKLLKTYFEAHDPTQVMRQGNDIGTQYRGVIFPTTTEQFETAKEVKEKYNEELNRRGKEDIATEIYDLPAPIFYYAEEYHQQYLAKNPDGYCGLKGTGISCPIPSP